MMGVTKIEWADYTFNPWRGCTKVSAGCDHCYAERQSKRNPAVLGEWGADGRRAIAAESYWRLPIKWNEEAARDGVRRRVFVGSLMDVFEDRPELVAPRHRLFNLMYRLDSLDWLLLTKRPMNWRRCWPFVPVPGHVSQNEGDGKRWLQLPNVWIGTTIENQAAADERIPSLLEIPAAKRFLSCEPLLGAVNLWLDCLEPDPDTGIPFFRHNPDRYHPCDYACGGDDIPGGIDWVIAGGESGPKARPSHPDWFRGLRDQCQAAGVPFFFKQWGEWLGGDAFCDPKGEIYLKAQDGFEYDIGPANIMRWADWGPDENESVGALRIGKKHAGRLLDGREWNEFPEAQKKG